MTGEAALIRLLQLASPMLPVGAYAYSQGLEAAIEASTVSDAATAALWIGDALALGFARFELPLLGRMMTALADGDDPEPWHALFLAGRDSAEAHAETLQMGYSLSSLLVELGLASAGEGETAFPLAYARAAVGFGLAPEAALQAYAWSWLENQAAVAMKTVPIGQVAAQRLLLDLGGRIPALVTEALGADEAALSNVAPGLALASCRHETQYSRLFRS